MNRVMIWATALLLMVAGMTVASEANAGLFNRKNDCCNPEPCCKPARQGLFAKLKAKRAAKDCCEPAPCCAPEPTCCEAAPACAAPAPCGCSAPAPVADCGCSAAVVAPAPCAVAATPCGCEAPVSTCGCSAPAPSCGCEQTVNCDCLSRRKLRKANRKGQCCGAQANTCNTCSAAVQTVSYAAPVEGCSSCGGGEVIIESTPAAPAAGEEAAPEAPEAPKSDTTT